MHTTQRFDMPVGRSEGFWPRRLTGPRSTPWDESGADPYPYDEDLAPVEDQYPEDTDDVQPMRVPAPPVWNPPRRGPMSMMPPRLWHAEAYSAKHRADEHPQHRRSTTSPVAWPTELGIYK